MTRHRGYTKSGYQLLDNFAKLSALRERHGRFAATSTGVDAEQLPHLEAVRHLMKLAEREAITAGAPRPSYPFSARDVADMHRDASDRVCFRLHDGRVFTDQGEPLGCDKTGL